MQCVGITRDKKTELTGHAMSVRVFQQNVHICRCLCVQALRRQRLAVLEVYAWIDSNPKNHSLKA
jgi:hypothetical protein